ELWLYVLAALFIDSLQWSHVLSNVERKAVIPRPSAFPGGLQWSHVLSNVERAGIRTLSNTQSYSTDFE
ncbi:MAG: hypothetical protein ACOYLF_03135, partial [Blastocatellia bacterium]